MYLTQLREFGARHGHWPGQCDVMMLNHCFDIADAALNSWKEAHDAFAQRIPKAQDPQFISHGVHMAFTRRVIKAFRDFEEDAAVTRFATNKFPSECLAYALLVQWIERDLADKGHKPGHTVRSKCQRYRATYSPEWCKILPWCTFRNGTACRQFATLKEAKANLESYGAKFEETPDATE